MFLFFQSYLDSFDRDVIFTGVFRVWNIFAGASLLIVIPFWLSKEEQGFFFLLYSILNMQVLFDLGLNQIILQRLSKHYEDVKKLTSQDEVDNLSPFNVLLINARKWFKNIALIYFIVCITVLYFLIKDTNFGDINNLIIALIFVFIAAINVRLSLEFISLQAKQMVSAVSIFRLIQSAIAYTVFFALIFFVDIGLSAMLSIQLVTCVTSLFWLKNKRKSVELISKNRINYFKEILPLQSKLAVTWAASFLVTQSLVTISFKTNGAVFSGRLGITLSAILSITTLTVALFGAKLPAMANLIGKKSFEHANSLFSTGIIRSSISYIFICILMSTFFFISIYSLPNSLISTLIDRFLDYYFVLCLLINQFAACMVICISSYLRIFEEEPLLYINATYSLVIFIGALLMLETYTTTFFILLAILPFFSTVPAAFYYLQKRH